MRFMLYSMRFLFRGIDYFRRRANRWAAENDGLRIGVGTILVGTQNFGSEPFLISIGRNCLVTNGVSFITHDGSIQVPLIKLGERIEDVYSKKSTFSKIEIGDNVFIGVGVIILPGSKISSNSIVAAGSVVKGAFREGVVIAGNPAKEICELEDYFLKNRDRIINLEDSRLDRKKAILKSL